MIEMLYSPRMVTMVFEKRLPIRRLWLYETDGLQDCVCPEVAATLRQDNSTTPCLYGR
jgi:hypothetical protein